MKLLTQWFLGLAPNKDRASVEAVLAKLIQRYSEPHRYYHNLIHLENGLESFFELFPKISSIDLFSWAYHDVVYEPLSSDNEERSAACFMNDREALGFSLEEADVITENILATKHTGASVSIVNDIDLSILGKDLFTYSAYADNIKKEYSMLDEDVFLAGRIKILSHLLDRYYIYNNGTFRAKYEEEARKNIKNEIDCLTEMLHKKDALSECFEEVK
jgi:predicted metal-dependent HD superfamily phosphohydrolase